MINLWKTSRKKLLLLLLPAFYLSLSILWSENPLRGILTAGILWCLIISAVVILTTFRKKTSEESLLFNKNKFAEIFLFGTSVVCLFCWIQCFLDINGVDRETSLLCLGCTSKSFGFPHPSGLTIEPQFMGNLLLAPALLSVYLLTKPADRTAPFLSRAHLSLTFVILSTLFLTFSRGAIYSFAVAYLLLLALNFVFRKDFRLVKSLPLVIFSFLFTLLAQGVFSAASYTNDTFLSGIEKSISQLSLGKIELSLEAPEKKEEKEGIETSNDSPTEEEASSTFSGYVEESTNIRLSLNSFALEIAKSSPKNLLFGTGLGSAGKALFKEGKTVFEKEIVQNEYLSLLLETGLLGLLLVVVDFIVLLIYLKKLLESEEFFLVFSTLVAFALSLNFFSGLPNALHLYLFPVFLVLLLAPLSKHKPVIN